jgi:ferritin
MLTQSIKDALNQQIAMEAQSSQAYLAMASWAEIQPGLDGVTNFFYQQSNEERVHMLKLIRYVNERGGFAVVPALPQPVVTFQSLQRVFQDFLRHEMEVSASINELVGLALQERDFATHNFLQWYVSEQLVGDDKSGIYMFDKDILLFRGHAGAAGNSEAT